MNTAVLTAIVTTATMGLVGGFVGTLLTTSILTPWLEKKENKKYPHGFGTPHDGMLHMQVPLPTEDFLLDALYKASRGEVSRLSFQLDMELTTQNIERMLEEIRHGGK